MASKIHASQIGRKELEDFWQPQRSRRKMTFGAPGRRLQHQAPKVYALVIIDGPLSIIEGFTMLNNNKGTLGFCRAEVTIAT